MHRPIRLAAASALVLLVAACVDLATTAPESASVRKVSTANITPGTCTNLSQLNALAATIFMPGTSPNINSVLGKLKNLDKLVKKGSFASAEVAATDIVAFTLKKYNQGGLAGTSAQVEAFTNAVLCFAGIDIDVEQPENTFLILPSDVPQIVTNTEGTGGVSFLGNPVFEPTLVEIELIPNDFPTAGDGPLDTKLDQYPGFIQITQTSEGGSPLAKPAVVGVCATGAIPQEVRDRLRLGHGAVAGFEITPSADASFLNCPTELADAGSQPLWRRLAQLVVPRALHASSALEGGGVGGTVTEFSPFAPVDVELAFGGGVGGTVTEFIRESSLSAIVSSSTPMLLTDCTTAIGGSDVAAECRPMITIKTALGTVLAGVPVSWNVTAGGGAVATRTTLCGASGASAATTTNALGQAAICWTLGGLGANSVKASPSAGGDAPAGVNFVPADTTFTMNAVAGPPVLMQALSPTNQQGVAGSAVPIAPTVLVTDSYGNPVAGVTVNWGFMVGGGALGANTTVTGAAGRTTNSWILGPTIGYQRVYVYFAHDEGAYSLFEATAIAP